MGKFIIVEPAGRKMLRAAGTPTFNSLAEAEAYKAECRNLSYKSAIKKLAK